MAGLVGYHYDSDEEESRRNSIGNEETLSTAQQAAALVPEASHPMEIDPPGKPESSQESDTAKKTPRRQTPPPPATTRVPYTGGYAEQWKRKATPVHVDQAVVEKYEEMFRRKAMGVDLNAQLEDSRALRNPCLYDVLMDRFDVDSTGSNVPKSARVFNWDEFTKADFYDDLR
uniref:SAP30_Sin3_bdg domain-containing protein n=1 Tax=Panagrellus redivivus TaxID=6233 RepID=A0A7E4ULW3_PANRE